MTRITCTCTTCKTNKVRPVDVPDTFAPAVDRRKAAHGLVFQANHPTLGGAFRAKTGIALVSA